jgi:hypothetical protein
VCYAYLSDVVDISPPETLSLQFKTSRWFTRGWTLQELLAPCSVRFYSAKWDHLGNREDLAQQIADTTRIENDFLLGKDIRRASIAKRFSWAALRETSRTEDIAYCLFGIFDVNMPLLYGEGKKAFIRLQEEIMKSSSDYSLFAWGIIDQPDGHEPANPDKSGSHLMTWKKDITLLKGLLASSPRAFVDSGSIVMHKPFIDRLVGKTPPPTVFAGGVRIELPTLKNWGKCTYWWDKPSFEQPRTGCIAILGCKVSDDSQDSIGIPLMGWGHGNMGRRDSLVLVSNKSYQPLWLRTVKPRLSQLSVKPEMRPDLQTGDIIFREYDCCGMADMGYDYPSLQVDYSLAERLLQPRAMPSNTRLFASYWSRNSTKNDSKGIGIVFGKVDVEGLSLAAKSLYVGFVDRDAKYTKGVKGSSLLNCLGEKLVAQQVLQSPSGLATWDVKHGVDVINVRISSERVSFVDCGRTISVDIIDIHIRNLAD